MENPAPGTLNWRLSAHPITLVTFLSFRIASLLVYLLGLLFTSNFVLIFIVTILLLAADFYYLKNIAGRRLVGLRWWNEVNPTSGESHWVFESAPQPNEPGGKLVNSTDKRFFWLALYCQPALWVALAIVAIVRLEPIWLTLVAIALVLTITNTLAFSRSVCTVANYISATFYDNQQSEKGSITMSGSSQTSSFDCGSFANVMVAGITALELDPLIAAAFILGGTICGAATS